MSNNYYYLFMSSLNLILVCVGVNPEDIRGSKVGVFVGSIDGESKDGWSRDPNTTEGLVLTGSVGGMLSNRLSYAFDFKGKF